jgi:hypothetical protein
VGEPRAVPPLELRRPRTLVVFGGAGNRRRAYGELAGDIARACSALAIEEIVDLGPPLQGLPAAVAGVPVRALGALGDAAASAVLAGAFAGFIGYPAPFLEKSSVFAAYCAHGAVPITGWRGRIRSRHRAGAPPPSWNAGTEPPPADPAVLAARARDWYAGHCLESVAAELGELLAPRAGDGDGSGASPRGGPGGGAVAS